MFIVDEKQFAIKKKIRGRNFSDGSAIDFNISYLCSVFGLITTPNFTVLFRFAVWSLRGTSY